MLADGRALRIQHRHLSGQGFQPAKDLRLPRAALGALQQLSPGHERVEVGASDGLALRLTDIVPQVESALIYILPIPGGLIDRVDVTTRLAFRLAVMAPDGSLRWSRVYDSGPELVKVRRESFLAQEPMETAMQRRFHEQAARLMRDAATDLRSWLEQERLRERVL